MMMFFAKPPHNRHTKGLGAYFCAKTLFMECLVNQGLILKNLRFIGEEVW
jgi:hypothetical protein